MGEPTTSEMAADVQAVSFGPLKRLILSPADMDTWTKSDAYDKLVQFISLCNQAVEGQPVVTTATSSVVMDLVHVLERLDVLIDDTPPNDQKQRFGNTAFRTWLDKVKAESQQLIEGVIGESHIDAAVEVNGYFVESFGNPLRIDYGTGHELAFCAFLGSLYMLNVVTKEDLADVVRVAFNRYMLLVRKVQKTYMLEPAGSHGVWGLDDYHFLPFLWGASQLKGHKHIKPKAFVKEDIYSNFSHQYMFLACIEYICTIKKGGLFAEHSPLLWDISAVPSWDKVNNGLVRMYRDEVLNKFPVVQHFLFGRLYTMMPLRP